MILCNLFSKDEKTYSNFIIKHNKIKAKKFAFVPFESRIVFVPHCMRNAGNCTAVEKSGYYICSECFNCKISKISVLVKELNYKSLYILKGGSIINKIINEQKPNGIVGIACLFEGYSAFKMLKNTDIAVQFIPLSKGGCFNTDVNFVELEKILRNIV
jgi:hypothetical protein